MIYWIGYLLFLGFAVFIDYKVFAVVGTRNVNRKAIQSMTYWALITLSTMVFIYFGYENDLFQGFMSQDTELTGAKAISLFFTGYLIEQSLSIDNIFVMAFLLSYFQVPAQNQGSLLSIGIWSAIILRGILIVAGLWLINSISWLIFVLGALLIFSGIKIFRSDPDNPEDPNKSFIIKLIRKWFPVTKSYHGTRFVIKKMGKRALTPLFLTLIAIEFTDILFALDSIPAIFAITTDPFIVLSSNILAVANLRALYAILSKILKRFEYINYALAILLILIGIKIILSHYVKIPEWASLSMIVVCIGGGMIFSLWKTRKDNAQK
jgi:tellurite resistance protein TerC